MKFDLLWKLKTNKKKICLTKPIKKFSNSLSERERKREREREREREKERQTEMEINTGDTQIKRRKKTK